eukprot:XP_011681419.1 PREDICTED: A disintegrin and metalloproteinase with thrombospondin motifs 6-like [Strongylocentrotus purpuratus]
MWCMAGFCRSSIGGIPAPVDGAWGEWPETFTQCSRTCGTGVTYRQRHCNNPAPRSGGKACEGPMFIMKTCNENPCPGIISADDFRDHECALTDPIEYQGQFHEWSGDLDGTLFGDSLCDLKCQSNFGDISIRHPSTVSDGTRCWADEVPDELRRTRRCLKTECKEFGCDGVYGSDALLDGCGVCEGTGRTCSFVQGDLRERIPAQSNEYWTWITVPIGATMVKITNTERSFQGLRLIVDGKSVFSPTILSRRFTVGDIHILLRSERYESEHLWVLTGPTTKPLQIDILIKYFINRSLSYILNNPSLFYEWYEPISDPVSYYWDVNPITECSVSCGGGNQTFMPICMEEINETRVNVSDRLCLEESTKPSHIQECNTQACPGAAWLIGILSQCSVTCANGINERFVDCIEASTLEVIPTIECVIKAGFRPNITMPCSQPACPTLKKEQP